MTRPGAGPTRGGEPLIINGLSAGPHKLVNANHQIILDQGVVNFVIP